MYQLTQLEPRLEVALQYRLKEREATSQKGSCLVKYHQRMHWISKNCRLKRLKNGEQKRKEHETKHCKVTFWWIIIGWSPPILKRNSWERVDIAGTQKIRQQPWCQMLYCCLEWARIGIFRWCQLDTTPLTPPKWFETLPENDHISHLCKRKMIDSKMCLWGGFCEDSLQQRLATSSDPY